jgi:heparin binding hemagglutinin HbhA
VTVTDVLQYPVDIASGIGKDNLRATKKEFENRGWEPISWGVDSHDALEFTVYRREGERDAYASLYLALSEDGAIEYALEGVIESAAHSRKIGIDSGTKSAVRAEDITTLLDKATARLDSPDSLGAPLVAAVGAADLALATVAGLLEELRKRAEETRSDARSRVADRRARLAKLQDELPEQLRELRLRFTSEELRSAAEGYVEAATSHYAELVERGEAALERLLSQAGSDDASASQTRAVGERATKLVGIELPRKSPVRKAPAKKTAAKKTPVKKAAAKKLVRQTPRRRG